MTKPEFISAELGTRVTAHALHVGDRINTMGFEGEVLSAVPLAIRVGKTGVAVLFRYGVAVLIGLSPQDESGFLEKLTPRIGGKLERFEEETAIVAFGSETEDQVQAGGTKKSEGPLRVIHVGFTMAHFRLSRDSGGIADIAPFRIRAMCGRLRVGKRNLHVCSIGRCSHVFGL
jgi:hypothetical protein